MTDRFTLSPFEFFVRHTRTRFPFRYGIASMTDVPHLFVSTTVTVAEKSSFGLSAEGLPPKWFTKNPATTFERDLPEMLQVIGHAAEFRSSGALANSQRGDRALSPVCLLVPDDQVGTAQVDRDARDTLHAIESGRCRASHGDSLRPGVNGGTGHRGI